MYNILKELPEIRKELMYGINEKDLMYITMMVNRLDTVIYKLSEQANNSDTREVNLPIKRDEL